MEYPYILTAQALTIFADGRQRQVRTDHEHFPEIKEALKQKDFEAIFALMDKAESVAEYWQGDVSVKDGVIFYKGQSVDNVLCDKILDMFDEGIDATPMAAFLDNLMQNPSHNAVQELYLFLEHGNLPITPDGHFLAYKKVNDAFMDYHTEKFDNSPGKVVEMPRNQVDDNRDNTCSSGLHFCSLAYLSAYYGSRGKVVILKINPRDVVSIPSDYNNTKGRTCRYEVISEYTGPETEHAFHSAVVDPTEDDDNSWGDPYGNDGDSWEDDSYAQEGFDNADLTTEEKAAYFAELDAETLAALEGTNDGATEVNLDGGGFIPTHDNNGTDPLPTADGSHEKPDHPDLHNDGIPKAVKELIGQTRIRGINTYEITAVAGPIRGPKGHYTGKWAVYVKDTSTNIEGVYDTQSVLKDKIFLVGAVHSITADVLRLAHEYKKNMEKNNDE